MKEKSEVLDQGEQSRRAWTESVEIDEKGVYVLPKNFLIEGCLLRIADTLELMTKDKAEMEKENLDLRGYKAQAQTQEQELKFLYHQCASLRGYITRIKNKQRKADKEDK